MNTAYRGDILAHVIQDSRASSMLMSSAYSSNGWGRSAAVSAGAAAVFRVCSGHVLLAGSLAALETFKLDLASIERR